MYTHTVYHDEPIYVTRGPTNFDSYEHSSSHHHSSSNLFEQKSQTIQQASEVLRTLINKLPEKDYHEGQHSIQTTVQISPSQEIGHHTEEFFVPPFKPMTANVPFNLNSLPSQTIKEQQQQPEITLHGSVPPPAGADPNAYKIYRAMAHKLASSKLVRPSQQSHKTTSKKPYLILDNFDQTEIFDAHNANSHNQKIPGPFNIQKTINFEFNGPIHPHHLKRQAPTDIIPIQKRQVRIVRKNVTNQNKRPAS